MLVSHAGELVTKRQLLESVWPSAIVEDNNINQCILAIRKALGESAGSNRFVMTVPGRGYRFVAPVIQQKRESPEPSGTDPTSPPGARRWKVSRCLRLRPWFWPCSRWIHRDASRNCSCSGIPQPANWSCTCEAAVRQTRVGGPRFRAFAGLPAAASRPAPAGRGACGQQRDGCAALVRPLHRGRAGSARRRCRQRGARQRVPAPGCTLITGLRRLRPPRARATAWSAACLHQPSAEGLHFGHLHVRRRTDEVAVQSVGDCHVTGPAQAGHWPETVARGSSGLAPDPVHAPPPRGSQRCHRRRRRVPASVQMSN